MNQVTRSLMALLVVGVTCLVSIANCDRTENEERYLQIPALGRSAQLGHLYNEVLDEFRDVSVFSQKIPEEFITKAIKPKLSTVFGPANNYKQIFKLFKIQETVAANVLAGFAQVDGSAGFLNDETFESSAPNEVKGALIQKYRTFKESLQVYFSNLKGLYNLDILNHKEATHVITGITYGTDIAVLFKGNQNEAEKSETAAAQLYKEMELLTGHELEAKEMNSTFTMSLTSDVPLPFKTSTNFTRVYNLLQEMPARISNFTDGKGLPMLYTLTPLTVIKRFLVPRSGPSNSANEINTWILKEIISSFDDVGSVERQINSLYKTLQSQPNCLLDESKKKIKKLKASTQELKSNLTTGFQEGLKADRMSIGPNKALRTLSQQCSSNEFGANSLKKQLSEFSNDLKRTEFCASLSASHPHIEYVGRDQNFDLKISQHFNQSVYVLFSKAQFTNNNLNEWQANLYTFLNDLNHPGNKLYIVDCDFRQAMCKNVSESVIHLYRNGRLVSPKVERVCEEEVDELKLQISQLNSTLGNLSEQTEEVSAKLKAEVTRNRNNIDGQQVGLDAVNRTAITNQDYIRNVTGKFATVETEVLKIKDDISAQQIGLDAVNRTAIQNQNSIRVLRSCEEEKPAFIANATTSASFGCSGTIQLPSKGESIVLDFNLPATKGPSQRCLWTLHTTQNNTFVGFRVELTLLCKHPARILDDNTLTFTEWHYKDRTYKGLTTRSISSSSQNAFLVSNDWDYRGFLSFNALTMDSEAGFILRFDVLDSFVWPSGRSSSATLTESVGSASYSLPSSDDFSSIVINPQPAAKMTLTVDVESSGQSNPCKDNDSVDILEFGMDGVPKQLGRLCGRNSVASYETENPVAALLAWNSGTSGRMVKLTWK